MAYLKKRLPYKCFSGSEINISTTIRSTEAISFSSQFKNLSYLHRTNQNHLFRRLDVSTKAGRLVQLEQYFEADMDVLTFDSPCIGRYVKLYKHKYIVICVDKL